MTIDSLENAKTWEEWKKEGWHIIQGQRAKWVDNKAVFTENQVVRILPRNKKSRSHYDSLDWDDMAEWGGYVDNYE